MSAAPPVRYARCADGPSVAYWTLGRGPGFLHVPNVQLSHLQTEWTIPGVRRFYESMARSFEVVRYDPRGGGQSERGVADLGVDALARDVEAVADAAGLERFVLFGWLTGGLPAVAYAARHPDRVSRLVLWCSFARNVSHGAAPRLKSLFEMAREDFELFTESISQAALGWSDAEQARLWARVVRDATTQEELLTYLASRQAWDVTDLLAQVQAPTLVVHDEGNPLASPERSAELASGIPDARLVVCGSDGGAPDADATDAIRAFARGEGAGVAVEGLTPRESEILAWIATGATNAEIAERLSISIHTVTRHLTHVYSKIGVQGRAQAVRFALDRGLSADLGAK